MRTSQELWDDAEAAYARAIDYEDRVEAAFYFELALEMHEGALRELKTSVHDIRLAVRRARRARSSARRAALMLIRTARKCAAANVVPTIQSDIEQEASRGAR